MFSLSAVLDPVSSFARQAVPILAALSRETLFTLDIYLTPTSATPASEELRSLYGTAFRTKLNFEEEETFEELANEVAFEGLREGETVEVTVAIDGTAVGDKRQVVVNGKSQVVVFKNDAAKVEEEKAQHPRDEL
jgi:hypothetical protein